MSRKGFMKALGIELASEVERSKVYAKTGVRKQQGWTDDYGKTNLTGLIVYAAKKWAISPENTLSKISKSENSKTKTYLLFINLL